jgi:hypothetical protein
MRWALLLLALSGCHWSGWPSLCLGGGSPSSVCTGVFTGATVVGEGAALNHDPWDAISAAVSSDGGADAGPR